MECVQCGMENNSNAKFCTSCGLNISFQKKCSCGSCLNEYDKYCGDCGLPVLSTAGSSDALSIGNSTPATDSSTRPYIYKIFPKMEHSEVVGREEYWEAFIGAALAMAAIEIVCFILIVAISTSEILASFIASLFGMYVFLKMFGHVYEGRLKDIGLYKNKKFQLLSIFIVLISIVPVLSTLATIVGCVVGVYVGVVKSKLGDESVVANQ
ncbi:uncharacterized membrane protein YhaH (DUF805 family) [Pseudomonas sp. TE12234]